MVTPLVILYLKVKIYKIMKKSQLRNIIRKSIKEMMGEKQPYNLNKPTEIMGKKKKWCRCGKMRNQMTYCKGNKSCDVCCQKAGHEGGIEDN